MSVPAWPMPIHQTKLVMSKAQPTGMLLPQTPMPLDQREVIAEQQQRRTRPRRWRTPRHQPLAGLRCQTIDASESVRVAGMSLLPHQRAVAARARRRRSVVQRVLRQQPSSPAPGSGCSSWPGRRCAAGCSARASSAKLRGRRAACATSVFGSLRSPKTMAWVGQACWQAVLTSPSRDRPVLDPAVDRASLDALHAVGALLHHAARAHRDVRVHLTSSAPGVLVLRSGGS